MYPTCYQSKRRPIRIRQRLFLWLFVLMGAIVPLKAVLLTIETPLITVLPGASVRP